MADDDGARVATEVFVERVQIGRRCTSLVGAVRCEAAWCVAAKERCHDAETGVVEINNYSAVDDVGRIINPMIVAGQLHGGIAHGAGQALLEACIYDASGQLASGSFMDYTMPRASNLPQFKLGSQVTLCPHNPLGAKGCGEAGTIASTAAVMNAVNDALAPLGVPHIDMPATAQNVWQAIQSAPTQQAAE